MKKSLILSAALFAALGASAEVYTYDFNQTPALFKTLQLPEDQDGFNLSGGTYELITRYGKPNAMLSNSDEQEDFAVAADGDVPAHARKNRIISLHDGMTYLLEPEENAYGYEVAPAEILAQPFLSWGEKGMARTIWDSKWGTDSIWVDKDYNAVTAEDWVATKCGISFNRLGTNGIVSRGDTWIQFPAVKGPAKITVWSGPLSDSKNSKNQDFKLRVTPIINGTVGEKVLVANEPYTDVVNKRYYKKEYSYDGTDNIAFRVGPEDKQLFLMHVVIEAAGPASGIEDIIAAPADENAPIYNVMGVQVDENYKGIVIKNGKKYVQK